MNEESQLTVFDGYDKQKIEVLFQEEAGLEIRVPLFYVNSGKKELASYVEEVCKPDLEEYTATKQEEIDSRVEEVHKPALSEYTQARQNDIFNYVETVSKQEIDGYVASEVAPHSETAQSSAAAALASEQAAKVSENNAKESELAAATSAAEAKQYRDEAEEILAPTQATEEKMGLAAIATTEDVSTGVDDTKIVTPQKLKAVSDTKASLTDLSSHTNNKSNPHGVTKAQIGLSNVDNTSDASKPISSAVQAALNAKASLSSAAFTGTPTFPTPSSGDNSTRGATTAWTRNNCLRFINYASRTDITPPTSTAKFTAPVDCIYVACLQPNNGNAFFELNINGKASGIGFHNSDSYTPNKDSISVFLKKGAVIYWDGSTAKATYSSCWYPMV